MIEIEILSSSFDLYLNYCLTKLIKINIFKYSGKFVFTRGVQKWKPNKEDRRNRRVVTAIQI